VGRAVAVAAHPISLWLGIGTTGIAELTARALALVPPDSHEAGRLLANHVWLAGISECDLAGAEAATTRGLEIARRQNDAALERRILANTAWVDVWHFHLQDGLERGIRAIELAHPAGDEHTALAAARPVGWALTALGEREQLRSYAEDTLATAERLREPWWVASASWDAARLAMYEGDWQAARHMSDISLAAQPDDPRPLAALALLEHELGNFEAGTPMRTGSTRQQRGCPRLVPSQSTSFSPPSRHSWAGSPATSTDSTRPWRRAKACLPFPGLFRFWQWSQGWDWRSSPFSDAMPQPPRSCTGLSSRSGVRRAGSSP
jgi:hypothetical protein